MISLPNKLDCCPLCQKTWENVESEYGEAYEQYQCSSHPTFLYLTKKEYNWYSYYKNVSNNLQIWWRQDEDAFIWDRSKCAITMTFSYIPPFNITLEQIKMLMVFS
jgi:hypothetical protein